MFVKYFQLKIKTARSDSSGFYFVRDGITITTSKMARAAHGSVQENSATNYISEFVRMFRKGTVQTFIALLLESTAKHRP